MKLQGIFPPIATPFDHDGNIYASKIQHNVEKWNLTTLSGYVVMRLHRRERHAHAGGEVHLWEKVAKYAAPEKLLIAGTGVESVRETVLAHQPRRRDGLQGGHGAHAALLQEPDQPYRRPDALLPLRGGPVQDPAHDLQLAADHRRRYPARGRGRAFASTPTSSPSRRARATSRR